MKPIKFKESNIVIAKDQPIYNQLPALKIDDEIISCWKLSFWERIRVLFCGKIWLSILTFNKPLSPSFLSTKKKDMFYSLK